MRTNNRRHRRQSLARAIAAVSFAGFSVLMLGAAVMLALAGSDAGHVQAASMALALSIVPALLALAAGIDYL